MGTDTQKLTESKSLLPSWYYDAFALRLAGLTYDKISEKLQKHPAYVRSIFAKGGKLYDFWRSYVENEKDERIQESLDMMHGHLPDVIRAMIIRAEKNGGIAGVEAGKVLLSYTMGKPEQHVKLDAKVGIFNFGDWALAQAESMKTKNAEQSEVQRTGEAPAALPE